MNTTQQKNLPFGYNGDQVIKTVQSKSINMQNQLMDVPTMSQFMQDDPMKYHLGMVPFFGQQSPAIQNGIFPELLKNKAVMEVNGPDGRFTYDIPLESSPHTFTSRDFSKQEGVLGIDNSKFKIGLSKLYTTGDILSNDPDYGQQIMVTDDEVDVQGDTFIHTVKLVTNDRQDYFMKSNLKKGITYFKVGHAIQGERATNFSGIDMPDITGHVRCEYHLGNMSGVEAAYTGKADMKKFSGVSTSSEEYKNKLLQEAEQMGDLSLLAGVNKKTGKITGVNSIAPTLQLLVERESMRLFSQQLMFQRAYEANEGKGVFRLNEGLWHQLRRGYKIQYSRHITRENIKDATEYVFRSNPHMQDVDRRVRFKCGTQAYNQVLNIFSEEINNQIGNIASFMGDTRQLPQNAITGNDNMELALNPVRFTKVFLPGIGNVEITRDTNLDTGMAPSDRLSNGFHPGGASHTTYSMVIWDALDQQYSNNAQMPSNTKVIDNGNQNANIYLVKPEGQMSISGYEQGRYSPYKSSDIMSSLKHMGGAYWNIMMGSIFVRDTSRYVVIEKDPKSRRGFN